MSTLDELRSAVRSALAGYMRDEQQHRQQRRVAVPRVWCSFLGLPTVPEMRDGVPTCGHCNATDHMTYIGRT
jgi:hypothetical protein